MALTESKIARLKSNGPDRMVKDRDGLYIRVRRSGSMSFVVRQYRAGKEKRFTLGPVGSMTLEQARERAAKYSKRPRANGMTLAQLLDRWFESEIEHKHKRPEQTAAYIRAIKEHSISDLRVKDIDRIDVSNFLREYGRGREVAANRCHQRINQCFNYAVAEGLIGPNDHPIKGMAAKFEEGERMRVLTDDEIRAIWFAESRHQPLLRFMLCTGQRIGETQKAQTQHIDDGVWFIPKLNNKSGRDHTVPLSGLAQSIIAELALTEPGRIFESQSPTATQSWLKRWNKRNDIGSDAMEERYQGAFQPHDLRRTLRTRLSKLGVSVMVCEKILNHSMNNAMLKTYDQHDYSDEMATALQLWADELVRIITPSDGCNGQSNPDSNVIPILRTAAV